MDGPKEQRLDGKCLSKSKYHFFSLLLKVIINLGQARTTSIMDLCESYDNFFFDCDGVVWQAEEQIGTAFDTIEELERRGKNVFFLTNNATKLQADCGAKMARMGYKNVKNSHIYTSASLVSKYVVKVYPEVRKVFCVGMKTVRDSLESEGIEVIGAEQHIEHPDSYFNEVVYDNYELD